MLNLKQLEFLLDMMLEHIESHNGSSEQAQLKNNIMNLNIHILSTA